MAPSGSHVNAPTISPISGGRGLGRRLLRLGSAGAVFGLAASFWRLPDGLAETSQPPPRHAAPARTKKKKRRPKQPVFPADGDRTRASQYARLGPAECLAELGRRDIHFRRVENAPGVRVPVRLEGPISGVSYRSDYSETERAKLPFDVFDCRLVVALSDFSAILRTHDIDEVRIFSAWRPPGRSWPEGETATAHPGALAVDLRLFKKSSGAELVVLTDFHGRIGAPPCGPNRVPPEPATPAALELRSIYCAAADARLFHVLLSPNNDYPHRNHFHVEVRPDVRWLIVR